MDDIQKVVISCLHPVEQVDSAPVNTRKLKMVKLTDMELKVLELAKKGMTTKEMANTLYRGLRTVEGYRRSIRIKLKSKTFTQACIKHFTTHV